MRKKPEIQNDVMDDPMNHKSSDLQLIKEQPQRERADLQLLKEHAQLQGSTRAKETKEQTHNKNEYMKKNKKSRANCRHELTT